MTIVALTPAQVLTIVRNEIRAENYAGAIALIDRVLAALEVVDTVVGQAEQTPHPPPEEERP